MCIKNELPISYITDGQRVPEDLQVANGPELVAATLRQLEEQSVGHHFWGQEETEANHMEFYK